MGQILTQETGQKFDVDRIFTDGGSPSQYAMVGGDKILIKAGAPGKPAIAQRGKAFFYMNCQPVTDPKDVEHLPEPYRTQALKFITEQQGKAATAGKKARARGADNPRAIRAAEKRGKKVKKFKPETALGSRAHRAVKPGEPDIE